MSAPLEGEFLTENAQLQNRKVRLTDALKLLANNGYEIIIPEAVTLECANVMRDGSTLGQHFRGNTNIFSPLTQQFLEEIPKLKGSIYIAPPHANDHSEPAQTIREIWSIHNSHARRTFKNTSIINARKNFKEDNNSISIIEFFRHMLKPEVPVFFLSQSIKAFQNASAVRSDININNLTPTGLFNAFHKENLLNALGIRDTCFSEFFAGMGERLNHAGVRARQNHWSYQEKIDGPYLDRTPIKNPPFRESLNGLGKKINAEMTDPFTSVKTHRTEDPKSRVERFTKNLVR